MGLGRCRALEREMEEKAEVTRLQARQMQQLQAQVAQYGERARLHADLEAAAVQTKAPSAHVVAGNLRSARR